VAGHTQADIDVACHGDRGCLCFRGPCSGPANPQRHRLRPTRCNARTGSRSCRSCPRRASQSAAPGCFPGNPFIIILMHCVISIIA
jgi:hypothetical protein